MTVRELIIRLLDCNLDKQVFIDYPANDNLQIGNYSDYERTKYFKVMELLNEIVIGVEE